MAAILGLLCLLCIICVDSTTLEARRSRPIARPYRARDSSPEACPMLCRCTPIETGNELSQRFLAASDSSDVKFLGKLLSHGHVYRRNYRGDLPGNKPARDMMCVGVRALPQRIPADIARISVYGDDPDKSTSSIAPIRDHRSPFSLTNQLTTINKHAFKHSQGLLELAVIGNSIKILKSGDFEYLPALVSLNLQKNGLKYLGPRVFKGLYQMRLLRLSGNALQNLPSGVFRDIPRLKELYLDGNGLRFLDEGIFSRLKSLEILDLSNNDLSLIGDPLFSNVGSLKQLRLDGNSLRNIRSEWFKNMKNLEVLSIGSNRIQHIGQNSLQGLQSLQELSLPRNRLHTVHPRAFRGLRRLRKLNLGDNGLITLDHEVFRDTSSLQSLQLFTNRIKSLPDGLFNRLDQLKNVDLSRNKVGSITNSVLRNLTHLQKLDVSRNSITTVQKGTFIGLMELKELNLGHNSIKTLEEECFTVSFANHLSKLTWLSLEYNFINNISPNNFRSSPHLKFLSLSHNKITLIHKRALLMLPNLHTLLLSHNAIPYLTQGIFYNLRNLRRLDIGHNHIKLLPNKVFDGLRSMDELNAEHNKIAYVSDQLFDDSPHITRVNISSNHIARFSFNSLDSSPKLTHLDISRNSLQQVVLSQRSKFKLRSLSFANNLLKYLGEKVMNILETHSKLDLHSNPWSCDCELSWIRRVWTDKQIKLLEKDETKCETPVWMDGRKVLSVKQSDLHCAANSVNEPEGPTNKYSSITDGQRPYNVQPIYPVTANVIPNVGTAQELLPATPSPPERKNNHIPTNVISYDRIRSPEWPQPLTTHPPRAYNPTQAIGPTHTTITDRSTRRPNRTRNPTHRRPQPTSKNAHDKWNNVHPRDRQQSWTLGGDTNDKYIPPHPTTTTQTTSSQTIKTPRLRDLYNEVPIPVPQGRPTTQLECKGQWNWGKTLDDLYLFKMKKDVKNFHVTVKDSARRPACNGVLLSDWWVLTTASCIQDGIMKSSSQRKKPIRYIVKIGQREVNKVSEIVIHPDYLARRSKKHDFALLKLKYFSLMAKAVTLPCVFPPREIKTFSRQGIAPAALTARFDGRGPRSTLQTLLVKLKVHSCKTNPDLCFRLHNSELANTTAFTDGAPLYLGYPDHWGLLGLGVSKSSHRRKVNQYTPVWNVLYWLDKVISLPDSNV